MNEHNVKSILLEELAQKFTNPDYPKQVVFETTSQCNLSCSMCSHPSMVRPQGRMDFALYQKVIDEVSAFPIPDLQVWLAVHGEPLLLGNRLVPFIQYAKQKGVPYTYLNTNGMLLTDKNIDNILGAGIDIIIVGLDGHSPETYSQARIGGVYSVVRDNTLRLLQAIKQRNLKTRVQVQFIIMPFNAHERDAFKAFWLDQGAEVKIREQITWANVCKAPLASTENITRIPCQWVINILQILWDGRVSLCGPDTECAVHVGDVTQESLLDIWQKKHSKYRNIHLNRDWQQLPDICIPCKDWVVGASEKYQPQTEVISIS